LAYCRSSPSLARMPSVCLLSFGCKVIGCGLGLGFAYFVVVNDVRVGRSQTRGAKSGLDVAGIVEILFRKVAVAYPLSRFTQNEQTTHADFHCCPPFVGGLVFNFFSERLVAHEANGHKIKLLLVLGFVFDM